MGSLRGHYVKFQRRTLVYEALSHFTVRPGRLLTLAIHLKTMRELRFHSEGTEVNAGAWLAHTSARHKTCSWQRYKVCGHASSFITKGYTWSPSMSSSWCFRIEEDSCRCIRSLAQKRTTTNNMMIA
ncbi:unnamed protein product [Ixodes persulcatus]